MIFIEVDQFNVKGKVMLVTTIRLFGILLYKKIENI